VLHGGFWRARYGKWIMSALCDDLARRGYAAWNVEYRRVGPLAHGGVPNTLDDVLAAVEFLSDVDAPLDLSRVSVVGHSAGGHLALWLAGATTVPKVFVALAGVADLRLAADLGLGDGIVPRFTAGNYALASPIERLPTGARTVLIHGRADVNVPIEVARSYHEAAVAAGEDVEFVERECDHMTLMDPRSEEWQLVLERLA
jgi:acetyl esterase/lipase